jgi:hypothetical protein
VVGKHDCEQGSGRTGKYRRDDGDHAGDRPVSLPAIAAESLYAEPVRWRDAQ